MMRLASTTLEGYIMQDKTYNGWTNYSTWRINLEMLDGMNPYYEYGVDRDASASEIAEFLKDYVESRISEEGSGITLGYALAFISYVNWHEIAEHMVADYTA
jgi:hypothetical protein